MTPARRKTKTTSRNGAPFLRQISSIAEQFDEARYPFNIPALKSGIDLSFGANVTFFVGENGSGKSTLLEALAECCGFSPQGGNHDHQRESLEERSELAQALRLSWRPRVTEGFFMRAESFYNFATYIDQVSDLRAMVANLFTSSPTENPSFLCSPIASSRVSTSWMSRRRRFRRNDSFRSSRSSTTSQHLDTRSSSSLPTHPFSSATRVRSSSTSTEILSRRSTIVRRSTSSSLATF